MSYDDPQLLYVEECARKEREDAYKEKMERSKRGVVDNNLIARAEREKEDALLARLNKARQELALALEESARLRKERDNAVAARDSYRSIANRYQRRLVTCQNALLNDDEPVPFSITAEGAAALEGSEE